MGWAEFVAAFAGFFISHSIPTRPAVRATLVARLGSHGFLIGYSALSLVMLAWLIGAAGRAPYIPLWGWAPWQNDVVMVVMALVCLLLAFAIGKPNPFSFGGANNDRFDPDAPGIIRLFRHPLLVALALWAFAHVLPNGDLAHVIVFAVFGGFAVLGQKIIDRRKQRQMGASWAKTLSQTRRARMAFSAAVIVRVTGAVLLYGVLIWLHPLLFGVSPLS